MVSFTATGGSCSVLYSNRTVGADSVAMWISMAMTDVSPKVIVPCIRVFARSS